MTIRSTQVGRLKPHLYHKVGLWSCWTHEGRYMLRMGRGFTLGTAYDYWQQYPRCLLKRDVFHIRPLTGVSNSTP